MGTDVHTPGYCRLCPLWRQTLVVANTNTRQQPTVFHFLKPSHCLESELRTVTLRGSWSLLTSDTVKALDEAVSTGWKRIPSCASRNMARWHTSVAIFIASSFTHKLGVTIWQTNIRGNPSLSLVLFLAFLCRLHRNVQC